MCAELAAGVHFDAISSSGDRQLSNIIIIIKLRNIQS